MRILIVTQYFWPERFIINDLAARLSEAGHEIVVATGKPNYPGGRIIGGYRQRGVDRETFAGGVKVVRVPLRPRGRARPRDLALNYLSFAWSASWRLPRLLKGRRFEAIVVFCVSPITAAIPAILLKRRTGGHVALWIQDLWPESLAATGIVRDRLAIGLVGPLVRRIYSGADTLLLQSAGFADHARRYGAASKAVYFPNFAPDPEPREAIALPAALGEALGTTFAVVFAGNLGRAQSLETILAAARRLLASRNIRIVIAGTGSKAAWLGRMVEIEGLNNVLLVGHLDHALMPALFERAGALLITLRDDPALNATVPSKLQAYMRFGRPIVAAAGGEVARLVAEAGAGLSVRAGDGDGLARCIEALSELTEEERARLGQAAQAYYEAHFDGAVDRLTQILETRMAAKTS